MIFVSHSPSLLPRRSSWCVRGVRVRPQTIFHPFYGCPVNVGKVNWLFKALVLRAAAASGGGGSHRDNKTQSHYFLSPLSNAAQHTNNRPPNRSPLRMQPEVSSTYTFLATESIISNKTQHFCYQSRILLQKNMQSNCRSIMFDHQTRIGRFLFKINRCNYFGFK